MGPWPKVSVDLEDILWWELKGGCFHRRKSQINVSDSCHREDRKSGCVTDHQFGLKIVGCFNDEFSFFDWLRPTVIWFHLVFAAFIATATVLNIIVYNLLEAIRFLAVLLTPFMPDTATKIFEQLNTEVKSTN